MGTAELRALLAAIVVAWPALGSTATQRVTVCLDYGCDYTRSIEIYATEWREVEAVFSGVASAEAERMAVAKAIGTLERIVGKKAGTARDAPRNNSPDTSIIGQLDCIAESTNTEKYLRLLAAAGRLVHHRVLGREVRRPWLFDAHWTAVIEEVATGERFAIDSWFGANGEPAIVQPLAIWRRGDPDDDAPR